jgi:hypothetical protein
MPTALEPTVWPSSPQRKGGGSLHFPLLQVVVTSLAL